MTISFYNEGSIVRILITIPNHSSPNRQKIMSKQVHQFQDRKDTLIAIALCHSHILGILYRMSAERHADFDSIRTAAGHNCQT